MFPHVFRVLDGRRPAALAARILVLAALGAALAAAPVRASEDDAAGGSTDRDRGEFDFEFRHRYEFVEQDANGRRDAHASTLRTRLVWRSPRWHGLRLTVGVDDLRDVIGENFDSTRNGKTQYQIVGDPKGTDLNLAALTWAGVEGLELTLGRQRILRNNYRFVGNVGWRQNEQTYDAFEALWNRGDFRASWAYVDRVRRVFGPDAGTPQATFDSDSHLLDASWSAGDAFSVAGYGYLLDFSDATAASNETFGVRFSGAPQVGDELRVTYVAELATQADRGPNPAEYDADYFRAEVGLGGARWEARVGFERLGGDAPGGPAFQTPLATLHAHNGWADKFLATPAGGLDDAFAGGSLTLGRYTMQLVLHRFASDVGPADYGEELDFSVSRPLGRRCTLLAKVAKYEAAAGPDNPPTGPLGQDTTKAWLMGTLAF